MQHDTYSLVDIARMLSVTERLVHFWAQAKVFEGPGRARGGHRYTEEHLGSLYLIKRLRDQKVPLAEIKRALERETPTSLRALAMKAKVSTPLKPVPTKQLVKALRADLPESDAASVPWVRLSLAPGVELHVQQPSSPSVKELVAELVNCARRTKERVR